MGGNGPLVVMDDADVDAAAEAAVMACFLCAGQSCTAGELLLVHEAVRDAFVRALAERVTRDIVLGDPFAQGTTLGPLNNEPVAAKMDEHVSDAEGRGANVVTGGARAGGFPTALYWPATILDGVPADAQAATEETFGPIAPVVSIGSVEEAIDITNRSGYGLLSAIFTKDLAQGLRFADEVRTGLVNINETTNYWENHLPVRRPRRDGQRDRARRRALPDGHAHRAADGRRQRLNASRISVSNAWTCSRIRAPARGASPATRAARSARCSSTAAGSAATRSSTRCQMRRESAHRRSSASRRYGLPAASQTKWWTRSSRRM